MLIFRECRVEKRRADEEGFYKADDYIAHCLFSENVELRKGELTRKGFIELTSMEAEDNEGDTEDLWVTLSSMGYNKTLVMDEVTHMNRYRNRK